MKTVVMQVTPDLAKMWLKLNTNNRPISKARVDSYARDMKTGAWKLTHQGIAITEDNVIGDGQHRLEAIVKSGVTVEMQVTTELPRDSFIAVDRGYTRSVTDALNMSSNDAAWVNRKVAAATQWAFQSLTRNGCSASEVFHHASRMKNSLIFATHNLGTQKMGITRAPIGAAIALIHAAGEDEMVLEDFCKKLVSGVIEGEEESSVVRLREFLMTSNTLGYLTSINSMSRTQRAFQLFRDRAPCKQLKAPENLPYPRWKA